MSAVAIAASVGIGGASVPAARAAMTISLRLPGGATTMLIGGDQTNTDIPIQVWATVTGTQAINPVPVAGNSATNPQVQTGTGDYFDGLQYLYYNVLNSNAAGNYIAGGIDTATGVGPTLNSVLGFNANGSQVGAVPNTVGGISVGSATAITGVAKPRSSAAVFDNLATYNQSAAVYQERGNDGANITTSGTTSNFLVETINFKPTAFNSSTKTTFTISIPSAAFTASSATDLSQANWFQDITNEDLGTGRPLSNVSGGGTQNSTPTVGTQVVIQDTLAGDANLDGTVGIADLAILAGNFGKASGATFAQGDFNGDGAVNIADLAILAGNFGQSIASPITPSESSSLFSTDLAEVEADEPSFAAALGATAVPEPAAVALVLLLGGTSLRRGSRRAMTGGGGACPTARGVDLCALSLPGVVV